MTATAPVYFATKYSSARDEVIALLSDEIEGYGRRDDTTGDVESPGGYFALVTIPSDVELTMPTPGDWVAVTPEDVAGTHIVTHNSQGFVSVETFEDEATARKTFECRAGYYAEWSDEERDGVYICPVTGHGYHQL